MHNNSNYLEELVIENIIYGHIESLFVYKDVITVVFDS